MWSQKTESEGGDLLSMAEDPNVQDVDTQKVDPNTPEDVTEDDIGAQVYAVLMALASNEAFDTAHGAGLGEWRRPHRRHGLAKQADLVVCIAKFQVRVRVRSIICGATMEKLEDRCPQGFS